MKGGGSGLSNEPFSLPAVGAAFDDTKSIFVNSGVRRETKVSSETGDDFDLKKYTEGKQRGDHSVETDPKDIFQMLEVKSKPVINFSNCKLSGDWNRCELTKDIDKPVAKKRKIQIVGGKIDVSQPSTSAGSSFTDTEKKTDTKNGTEVKKAAVTVEKKEIGKLYLKDVRIIDSRSNIYTFGINNFVSNFVFIGKTIVDGRKLQEIYCNGTKLHKKCRLRPAVENAGVSFPANGKYSSSIQR